MPGRGKGPGRSLPRRMAPRALRAGSQADARCHWPQIGQRYAIRSRSRPTMAAASRASLWVVYRRLRVHILSRCSRVGRLGIASGNVSRLARNCIGNSVRRETWAAPREGARPSQYNSVLLQFRHGWLFASSAKSSGRRGFRAWPSLPRPSQPASGMLRSGRQAIWPIHRRSIDQASHGDATGGWMLPMTRWQEVHLLFKDDGTGSCGLHDYYGSRHEADCREPAGVGRIVITRHDNSICPIPICPVANSTEAVILGEWHCGTTRRKSKLLNLAEDQLHQSWVRRIQAHAI